MLINILKHKIRPKGIIHVGANTGQEYDTYIKMGCHRVMFIEPCSAAFSVLKEKFKGYPHVTIVNTACGSKVGQAWINIEVANGGQSNSFLDMGTHTKLHPGIEFVDKEMVTITPLDFIDTNGYDFLMLDCQGTEGDILKGAKETLKRMKWVYTEVNAQEVYKGCTLKPEIDELLPDFVEVETVWFKPGTWGDSLYKRK